ncbi:MAG: amidohydrolase family protein [Armatimonadota bacterium]
MSNYLTIKNGNLLLPGGELRLTDLQIDGGIIAGIGSNPVGGAEIDAAGAYVLPGLIDLHVHGIGFESASSSSLAKLAELEAAHGATTFYPTLFAPPEGIAEQMQRHRQETDDLRQTPQAGGFRLESPYLHHAGGGLSKDTAPVSQETTEMLLNAGGGHIKIWDISPELPGAPDAVRYLADRGIVASIAHTYATIEQAKSAVDAGARLVTHLFDTFEIPEMTDPGVYPAGLIDYLLVEDRLTCEIIGDGTHVHPLLVEKAFRCKTPTRLAFVTDGNLGAGLSEGRYTLPEGWGDVWIDGSNNGVRLIDRDMGLAGSALTPIDSFRNAIHLFGKEIAMASEVCSKTPARLMGLNKGELAAGMDADVIIVSPELDLLYTIAGGKVVYRK